MLILLARIKNVFELLKFFNFDIFFYSHIGSNSLSLVATLKHMLRSGSWKIRENRTDDIIRGNGRGLMGDQRCEIIRIEKIADDGAGGKGLFGPGKMSDGLKRLVRNVIGVLRRGTRPKKTAVFRRRCENFIIVVWTIACKWRDNFKRLPAEPVLPSIKNELYCYIIRIGR